MFQAKGCSQDSQGVCEAEGRIKFFIKELTLPLGYLKQIIQIFFFIFHFIFWHFYAEQIRPGPYKNKQKWFHELFRFRKDIRLQSSKNSTPRSVSTIFLFLPI